jgi:hypothetical protein
MENDFSKHFKYRINFNKFQLPELIEKAPRVIRQNIDISPFKRVIKLYYIKKQRKK